MTRVDLVKLYNRLSWYFCTGDYPTVETKMTDSCEALLENLNTLYTEEQKTSKTSNKGKIKINNSEEKN